MAERIRVQKALSQAGVMSRRAAEEAIVAGRVAIDGRTARLGDRVDPASETLTLDGISVVIDPTIETHLLYKPVGVVSTANDPQGRPTVVDIVPSSRRLYPVGRLDIDSEGLILLTNDGELANKVTHPRYGVTKTYMVIAQGRMTPAEVRRLTSGLELEDGHAQAIAAKLVDTTAEGSLVEVVMGEGRKREVRRMFSALGHEVTRLVRTAIGPISDPRLAPGASRLLTQEERRRLLEQVGEP
ncbi:MAG TPA: pseudouridine synthase [Acidimicrobiia bacterium]